MDKPSISIIIPVYNSEKYIEQTLLGLLNQTYSDFEVICVNDCSSDNSMAILESYAKKDFRIKYIDLKENVGAGRARNAGIEKASGDYITFIDADDAVEPDLFEKAMAATDGGTVSEVVWGAAEEHYDSDGKLVKTVPIVPEKGYSTSPAEIASAALRLEEQTLFGYLWNSLYKADIIKANNLRIRDTIFYEDYFFNLDFIKYADSLKTIDYVGYHYYKRVNSSVTHRFTKEYFDLSYERIETFCNYCTENGVAEENVKAILGNRLIRYTLSALARNNNPLSGMDKKARKEWTAEMCELPLYGVLMKEGFKPNLISGLMKFLIEKKAVPAINIIGKAVYKLKK